MAETTLTVLRTRELSDGSMAIEARTPEDQTVTVWQGTPRYPAPCDHLGLADPLFRATTNGEPVWIENRPGLWLLADLAQPLNAATSIWLVCRVVDALARLHSLGRVHGSVSEETVIIQSDGSPCLIGLGRRDGSPADDLADAMALLRRLHPFDRLPVDVPSASSLAAALRETAMDSGLNECPVDVSNRLIAHRPPPDVPGQRLALQVAPLGLSDEVLPELGEDSVGRGLLDRWSSSTMGERGEQTDDPTETQGFATEDLRLHHDLIGRIHAALDAAEERYQSAYSPPGASFRNHIVNETIDPLPTANGIDHGPIHNPHDRTEQTAELSASDITNPSLPPIGAMTATTGNTDGLPIQQSVLTGLLWATVVGMMAAAVMLLAVWLIISGVF